MAALTAWLAKLPSTTNCSGGNWADSNEHVIFASKVVVRPWYGPHHVYGIFAVPVQYREAPYSATVTVCGLKERAALGSSSPDMRAEGITIAPGYYAVRAYLPTRVALRFFVAGRAGDLRSTSNWALVFRHKKSSLRR